MNGYLNRARVLMKVGDLDLSLQDTNTAMSICPVEYGYFQRGDIYRERNELDKAIDDYTRADRLHPHWPELLESRALAYEALGKSVEAERDRAACAEAKKRGVAEDEVEAIIAQIRAQGGTLTVTTSGELDVTGIRLTGTALEDVRRLKPKIIEHLLRRG